MRHTVLARSSWLGLALLLAACEKPHIEGKPIVVMKSEGATRVAVVARQAPRLREVVESKLLLLDGQSLTVIARAEQDLIGAEKSLQYSGDFSDEAMIALGQQLGATLLLVVVETASERSMFEYGNSRYGVRISAIDVEKGAVVGFATTDATTQAVNGDDVFASCNFDCLQGRVVEMALQRLLGSSR